jgi:hypothetical protein
MVLTLGITKTSAQQGSPVPNRRTRQNNVLVRLVDGSKVWIEGALMHKALIAQIRKVQQHCALGSGQISTGPALVHLWQNVSTKTHELSPLAGVGTLGSRPTSSTEEISSELAQGVTLGEVRAKGCEGKGGVPRLNVTATSCRPW